MNIQLKDGTALSVTETQEDFGNAYNLDKAISEDIFTDDNLSEVTIDGVSKGRMKLDFFRPDGLQFYLVEPTPIEQQVYESTSSESLFKIVGASSGKITVPANETISQQIALDIPKGFTLAAFRQIALQSATKATDNDDVSLRWFGTVEGGTKANISLKNHGDSDVSLKVEITCFCVKE